NVLYGDGHVEFQPNPFVGKNRDNIYTYGPPGEGHAWKPGQGIAGSPTGGDAILLPAASDLGVTDASGTWAQQAPKAYTDAEAKAVRKQIVGKYSRSE